MTYIEYSGSNGHGTLIFHTVAAWPAFVRSTNAETAGPSGDYPDRLIQDYEITKARYDEFIALHGGASLLPTQ